MKTHHHDRPARLGPAPAGMAAARIRWGAIQQAQAADPGARLPFLVDDGGRLRLAGSVARAHTAALARWPQALLVSHANVTLRVPPLEREAFFHMANAQLRADGLIVAWRNETYPVSALNEDGPSVLLATFERAASRFWGTATLGAHCNGYVADDSGRPTHLWIARRSMNKATDPGMLDNLVGGGVPHGQTPAETVVREGWEEAGLTQQQMAALQPGRRFRVARDIPEGFQLEWVSVYDLPLPDGLVPANQDGEVQDITLMSIAQALEQAATGRMTVDAALVTLDFALRHKLLPAARHQQLSTASQGLWAGNAEL